MRSIIKYLLNTVILLSVSGPVLAFKISPCLRVLTLENNKLSQERIRCINLCPLLREELKLAVHEHMTLGSIREYRGNAALETTESGWKYQYMIEPKWSKKEGGRFHESHAIMFGTWWNDDPLMRLWGQGLVDFIGGAFADKKMLKADQATYPGGIYNCAVPANEHIGRWSHFGELQHLHFMTDKKRDESTSAERVSTTTDRALNWMAFAYRVATGDLSPEEILTKELQSAAGLPSISLNHCVDDGGNVKIRTLFSRIGQEEIYRNQITPDVALGSMLHVIQDSFSPAHTCRVVQHGEQSLQAVISDVSNYSEQKSDDHGSLDVYPSWLIEYTADGKQVYENDPVSVGAWLIEAVDERLPWYQVEAHLRRTIFLSSKMNPAAEREKCIGQLGAAIE